MAKEIETVGRRRLVVRSEEGHVKIDINIGDKRIATLDLEPHDAAELEKEIHGQRMAATRSKKK